MDDTVLLCIFIVYTLYFINIIYYYYCYYYHCVWKGLQISYVDVNILNICLYYSSHFTDMLL